MPVTENENLTVHTQMHFPSFFEHTLPPTRSHLASLFHQCRTLVSEVAVFSGVFSHQCPCVGFLGVSFRTLENLHYVAGEPFAGPALGLDDHFVGGGHDVGGSYHWLGIGDENEHLLGQIVHQSEGNSC